MSIRRISATLLALAALGCHQRGSRPPTPADSVNDGYGERARDQAPGASSVDVARSSRQVSRIEELLEGLPGVEVRRSSGGGYSVRIRGAGGSFMSGEEPLFVVDGVPLDGSAGRNLAWLNPADVERISVLKDPSQTSLYGVRGANGVIVITTKKPR